MSAAARDDDRLGPGDRLTLVDASGFVFRAFHALPPLTRKSDGLPVGAVAGFCNMLWRMLDEMTEASRPTHLAVIFDKGSKSFRNDLFAGYKAQRPDPPEELVPQFPLVRDATRAFGLPCVELANYEADDLIATYARRAADSGADVTVVSSDKDLMQLVREAGDGRGAIRLYDPMKAKPIERAEVIEKFGAPPEKVVDIQALAGDSVDNVPGAPGIGVKTAAQLIAEFGDLDTLLANAASIKQPKRRETLLTHADQIRLSRRLVTLDDAAPTPEPLSAFALQPAPASTLVAFLKAMEFRTLTRRVADRLGVDADAIEANGAVSVTRDLAAAPAAALPPRPDAPLALPPIAAGVAATELPIDPAAYETVTSLAALDVWIARIRERGHVAIDTETTALDAMTADLVGVSLAVEPGRAAYVPVGHTRGAGDLLEQAGLVEGQLPLGEVIDRLRPVLEDRSILKIGQNLKYDLAVLARHGMPDVAPIDDTMLLSYALASGLRSHGMDALSIELLGHTPIPIKELIGSGKTQVTFDRVEIATATRYAAEDADVTLRLHRLLKPQLTRDRLTTVYETLERPLLPVLVAMERAGVYVDVQALSRLSGRFAQRMAALEADIHRLAGGPFNIGSPKQLGEVLFDRMGLAGGKKGKTGAFSTGADVLEELAAQGHDLPARVLDWRQLSKLKGTYTDALPNYVNRDTGRVHTSFSLAATTTGRLASTDPNLQNIPVRSEEGRQIREAFVAPQGKRIVSLDYSQIELRILAHIADITALKSAFRDGLDIHAMTASEVFGVPIEGMDPMVRRRAKAINFGVIYGISAFGLSNQLRIPRADAQTFIDAYFARFPGIRGYMDRTVADAKKRGYVETLFGRRIHTPEIGTKGPGAGFAARAAINAPIQGAAADIIRRAMIRIPDALAAHRLPAAMLLQVHDELLFEVDAAAVDETIAVVKAVMERAPDPAVALDVPLVVDAGQGASWAAAH